MANYGLKLLTKERIYYIKTSRRQQKTIKTLTVDVSSPTENGVFDPASYAKFLIDHIKVDGTIGNLGNAITVEEDGSIVTIVSTTKFSGKYLKYLTKKYLKKNQLRDWIRFISIKKNNYKLSFYQVTPEEDADEEEDAE
ncbi:60S ribosomal protein eL22 NDAI_0G03080 [Naumovozyma dairenensis CBS 421]|uniref:L1c n=1 Tax=Naumovozyma dairenensis (strain ATCC 10597 / BCRC 20456 / CBS 421 / NBRC 0211 / NRRL Y-12639) TaxID=1071378 RepID=G0WE74_NAUDC|nr:hypothetical protein NDAI_0G03080 [Naumovozyma dairenensis CBS 421]CCD26085.2 hypothetical protein NDAI_0G03080 [Naumovozyma dairenensis CBS 421]